MRVKGTYIYKPYSYSKEEIKICDIKTIYFSSNEVWTGKTRTERDGCSDWEVKITYPITDFLNIYIEADSGEIIYIYRNLEKLEIEGKRAEGK